MHNTQSILALAVLVLTLASLATSITYSLSPTISIEGIDPGYVAEAIAYYASRYAAAAPVYRVYNEIAEAENYVSSDPSKAWSLLVDAIYTDTDKDGLYDLEELYNGFNPFSSRSFCAPDMIHMARAGPYIDGFLNEWGAIAHREYKLTIPEDPFPSYPGTLPIKLLVTKKPGLVYVAIAFKDGPIANTSYVRYEVYTEANGTRYYPLAIAMADGIEAVFSDEIFSATGEADICLVENVSGGRAFFSIGVFSNKIPAAAVLDSVLDEYKEPLWVWHRSIPRNLPWYPVIVYGDNRPSDWTGSYQYDRPFLDNLAQFMISNPVAFIGTGDHVGAGRRDQIDEFLRLLIGFSNMWVVAGNHDWSYVNLGADREYWETMVAPNFYYRDDIPGWRIIFINGYAIDNGVDRQDIIDAIEGSGSRSVILVFHVPPMTTNYNYPTDFSFEQMEFLRQVIKDYSGKIKLVLVGHWHVWREEDYYGVNVIVTGGGGAPLSSSSLGLPIYHYVSLILYPNGTYSTTPIGTYRGIIDVEEEHPSALKWVYTIENYKEDVYGNHISYPIRIEKYVKGLDVQVFIKAPYGTSTLSISCNGTSIEVRTSATTDWFVLIGGIVYRPTSNTVVAKLGGFGTGYSINITPHDINKTITISVLRETPYPTTLSLLIHSPEAPYTSSNTLEWVNESYAAGFTLVPADNTYTIDVYVCNGLNVSIAYTTTMLIDVYPPTIKVMYLPEYTSTTLNSSIVVSDYTLNNITVMIDDKIVYTNTTTERYVKMDLTIDTSMFKEGTHYITITAADSAGHNSVYEQKLVIDKTPPQVIIVGPLYIEKPSLTDTIKIVVLDAYPDKIEICVNGTLTYFGEPKNDYYLWELGIVTNGTYLIKAIAYDKAGNSGESTAIIRVGSIQETSTTTTTTTTTTTSTTTTAATTTTTTTTITPSPTTTTSSATTTTASPATATPPPATRPPLQLVVLAVIAVAIILIFFVITKRIKAR